MNDKLEIPKYKRRVNESGNMLRVSEKTYALLGDLAEKSGRSRSYIANMMIEFAYDRCRIVDSGDASDDDYEEV